MAAFLALAVGTARAGTCDSLPSLRGAAEGAPSVSTLLSRLDLQGAAGAAVFSVSAQSSRGWFDPRLLVFTDCFVLTYSLLSPNLEGGLLGAVATAPVPGKPSSSEHGEILFELEPTRSGFHLHVDHWDAKAGTDSLRCTRCHVDLNTKGALGFASLTLDGNPFTAVVNPYFDSMDRISSSASWASFCVEEGPRYGNAVRPTDLDRLYRCLCVSPRLATPECRGHEKALENPWVVPGSEACRRLEVTRQIGLRQEWRYDPRASKQFGPCHFGR